MKALSSLESGQTAAAFGGTTCHVDFVIQPQGETFATALDMWKEKANGKQMIDMGYHMAITDLDVTGENWQKEDVQVTEGGE